MLRAIWLLIFFFSTTAVWADSAQKTFKVTAQITTGCLLGNGTGTPGADFGTDRKSVV